MSFNLYFHQFSKLEMKYFIFWIIFIQITYSYGISNRRNEHNLQHLDENHSTSKTEKLTIHDDDDDNNNNDLFQENSKHEEQMEHFYYKKFSISKLNDTHSNGSNELVTNYIKDNNFKLIIDSSDKLKWIMNKFFKDYKNKPEFVDNEEDDDDDDDDDDEDDDEDEEHEEEDAEENEDEEDTEERKRENEEDHDSNSVGDENDDDDDDNKNKHVKRRNRRHRKKKRNNSRRGSQNLMWR